MTKGAWCVLIVAIVLVVLYEAADQAEQSLSDYLFGLSGDVKDAFGSVSDGVSDVASGVAGNPAPSQISAGVFGFVDAVIADIRSW